MTFLHLEWLYVAVPLLLIAMAVRFWRRHYWGHSLVRQMQEEIGGPNPILRMPNILEGAAVAFLVAALLGPIYPFVVNRIERGGLQILMVLDLSQSMEIPLGNRTRMEAVKASATEFIERRPGDAVGLVVFSHNGYLVTPATFDHESLLSYLSRVSPQTLAHEGYTAIGEGLAAAQEFFLFSRERGGRGKGEVIVPVQRWRKQLGTRSASGSGARTAGRRPYLLHRGGPATGRSPADCRGGPVNGRKIL